LLKIHKKQDFISYINLLRKYNIESLNQKINNLINHIVYEKIQIKKSKLQNLVEKLSSKQNSAKINEEIQKIYRESDKNYLAFIHSPNSYDLVDLRNKLCIQYTISGKIAKLNKYHPIYLQNSVYMLRNHGIKFYKTDIPDLLKTRYSKLVKLASRPVYSVLMYGFNITQNNIFSLGYLDTDISIVAIQSYDIHNEKWKIMPKFIMTASHEKCGFWPFDDRFIFAVDFERICKLDILDCEKGWELVRYKKNLFTISVGIHGIQCDLWNSLILIEKGINYNNDEYGYLGSNSVSVYKFQHKSTITENIAEWLDKAININNPILKIYKGKYLYGMRKERYFDIKNLKIMRQNFNYY